MKTGICPINLTIKRRSKFSFVFERLVRMHWHDHWTTSDKKGTGFSGLERAEEEWKTIWRQKWKIFCVLISVYKSSADSVFRISSNHTQELARSQLRLENSSSKQKKKKHDLCFKECSKRLPGDEAQNPVPALVSHEHPGVLPSLIYQDPLN